MSRITVTVREHHEDIIDDVRDTENLDSDAATVRWCIERAAEMQQLESELQQTRAERDDLRRQLAAVNSRQEDITEIVKYVDEEQSWRKAGLMTRTKWWLFGRND